jgi:hypothetical protein
MHYHKYYLYIQYYCYKLLIFIRKFYSVPWRRPNMALKFDGGNYASAFDSKQIQKRLLLRVSHLIEDRHPHFGHREINKLR